MGGIFGIISSMLFEQFKRVEVENDPINSDLKFNFSANQKNILISFIVLLTISSVFGLILFLNSFTEEPGDLLPTPSPESLGKLFELNQESKQNPNVKGENIRLEQFGPKKPSPTPTPTTPSSSPSPSPSNSPSPSPSPTPSPTPTPTPQPTSNPISTPTSTPSPSPTPSPSESPSPNPSNSTSPSP